MRLTLLITIYSCVTSLATDFLLKLMQIETSLITLKSNTGSVVVVDFNLSSDKREELMDIGYRLTMGLF